MTRSGHNGCRRDASDRLLLISCTGGHGNDHVAIILFTSRPAGCGKTLAAKALTKGLKRPDFYFNLGATQDARATLIGNTHFDSKKGTFFAESAFVKAITTPNAVVLLDELSRAHPDAWNI